jgi:hypothetical protein
MGADKNSSSKNSAYVPIATPKVTHEHLSPRQHSYGSATSPGNDSSKHTRKHWRRSNRTHQTWQDSVYRSDCPPGCRGLSAREGADCPEDRRGRSAVQKMLPAGKHRFCLNGPQNGLRSLADCPPAANCPPNSRGRSVDQQRRKTRTRKNTSPNSSPDLPNG